MATELRCSRTFLRRYTGAQLLRLIQYHQLEKASRSYVSPTLKLVIGEDIDIGFRQVIGPYPLDNVDPQVRELLDPFFPLLRKVSLHNDGSGQHSLLQDAPNGRVSLAETNIVAEEQ